MVVLPIVPLPLPCCCRCARALATGVNLTMRAGEWPGPLPARLPCCRPALLSLRPYLPAPCLPALPRAETSAVLSKAGMLTPDGRCKTLDATAGEEFD